MEENLSYFRDEERIIDFILVYKSHNAKDSRREYFLKELQSFGVEMEEESYEEETFIKVFVPFDLLCQYAELMKFTIPVKEQKTMRRTSLYSRMFSMLRPKSETNSVSISFINKYKQRYVGIEDEETFFAPKQRHKIAYEILSECRYDPFDDTEVGISNLLRSKVFEAAYPLHEVHFHRNSSVRRELKLNWASFSRIFWPQPFESICNYFGEHIAIYFSWLGFYNGFLGAAALIGTGVFLYGGISITSYQPIKELCSSNYDMCSLCDTCSNWKLNKFCSENMVGYLFDHDGTIFFSIFMSFWAVTFLEFWKRKSKINAHLWDSSTVDTENKKIRPQYAAKAKTKKVNPVTEKLEPYVDFSHRIKRIFVSWSFLISMISVIIISMVSVVVYRCVVNVTIANREEDVRQWSKLIASVSGSLISFIIINILELFYKKFAVKLTDWEMHKTNEKYENQLAIKVFAFKFVNFCSPLVYIAFFKGRFVGHPGGYNTIFSIRLEQCSESGCMYDLGIQLGVILIGTQVINNVSEILIPFLKRKFKIRGISYTRLESWKSDFILSENPGLLQEYLEMVLQFGLVVMFAIAFPLLPLFSLINNLLEIRIDAIKFLCLHRRTIAKRRKNIGIWMEILVILVKFSVFVNAVLIAFTSTFLERTYYKFNFRRDLKGFVNFTLSTYTNSTGSTCRYHGYYDQNGGLTIDYWKLLALRFGFIAIYEKIIFSVQNLIDVIIPDIPKELLIEQKRKKYLAATLYNQIWLEINEMKVKK